MRISSLAEKEKKGPQGGYQNCAAKAGVGHWTLRPCDQAALLSARCQASKKRFCQASKTDFARSKTKISPASKNEIAASKSVLDAWLSRFQMLGGFCQASKKDVFATQASKKHALLDYC